MQCFPGTTGISVPWIDFTPSTRQGEEVAQRTKCQSLESVLGLPACTLSHPTEPWGAPDLSSTDKGQVCPRISTALRHQRGTHPPPLTPALPGPRPSSGDLDFKEYFSHRQPSRAPTPLFLHFSHPTPNTWPAAQPPPSSQCSQPGCPPASTVITITVATEPHGFPCSLPAHEGQVGAQGPSQTPLIFQGGSLSAESTHSRSHASFTTCLLSDGPRPGREARGPQFPHPCNGVTPAS